ncbi:hypothetical protein ACFV6D_22025 [Kitasatospora sp. NPDC059812]|uniref:hypothetical protein n=1 Tax=Kitasatospora sp. NPDC059812 TaxID=3346958 RepID=UPI00365B962A
MATLGPEGTDAHCEALRHFGTVLLVDSFESAVRTALDGGCHAMVAAGYGALTSGILPHLATLPDTRVALNSRHLAQAPHPAIPLITPAEITEHRPDLIAGCFESDARSRTFWTHEHVAAAITEHHPACIELSTLSPERPSSGTGTSPPSAASPGSVPSPAPAPAPGPAPCPRSSTRPPRTRQPNAP